MRLSILTFLSGLATHPALAVDVARQNEIVQQYCAVCHTDSFQNGGLSLEHFDAAKPDPGVAAMVVGKMKSNAFGASGQPLPDKPTRDAVIAALSEKAGDAEKWSVTSTSAAIVRNTDPDVYRLVVTCQPTTREGRVFFAWSPRVPPHGSTVAASVDGHPPSIHEVDGSEKMFIGATDTAGTGATQWPATKLPQRTLQIVSPFGNTIDYPFDALPAAARKSLSACFSR